MPKPKIINQKTETNLQMINIKTKLNTLASKSDYPLISWICNQYLMKFEDNKHLPFSKGKTIISRISSSTILPIQENCLLSTITEATERLYQTPSEINLCLALKTYLQEKDVNYEKTS